MLAEHHSTHLINDQTFNSCTIEESIRPYSRKVSKIKYNNTFEAIKVLSYIIENLDLNGAPVSLMFGTMLHEYRSGTGPCVQLNLEDKDFDIVLFEPDFSFVISMGKEIETKFRWKIFFLNEERLFLSILPPGQERLGRGFQIDVYGFKINYPREGLIYFPWQKLTVAMDAFLPLVKYKKIPTISGKQEMFYFYMPSHVPCLLSNLYGADFMTPKKGKARSIAYGNPKCSDITI